jgi:hypothetical protein
MRWYTSNNTLRFQFCGDILRPMQPVFTFDYFVKGDQFIDYEKVENCIREFLPHIKVAKCRHCGNRFGAKMMGGVMTCADCSAVSQSDKSGYIYLYGNSKFNWYKIGRSNRPNARIAALDAIQLPFECHVLHTFLADDAVKAESDIHSLYSDKRQNGEWFELSRKDIEEIKSIKRYEVGTFQILNWSNNHK